MDNVERQIAEFLDEIVANVKKERVKRGVSYNLHHLYLIANEFGMDIRDLLPSSKSELCGGLE